jgi:DNA-binding NarL/FixJ family response regulator
MKLLIVEDDPLHRAYLRDAIAAAIPECTEIIEAENGLKGEQLAREHGSEFIVMDLQMNTRTGIEAARTIWRERPETAILFWSNYSDEAYVRGVSRIVPEGAAYGYVLKTASEDRLKLALRAIFVEGQCVIDREVRGLQQKSLGHRAGFTDSEYEVLLDIALGLTDRAIAERRNLSLRSVQNRLQQLYEKLGIYKTTTGASDPATFNLRSRAVSVALLRKLLNISAIEQAEAEFVKWDESNSEPLT